MSTLLEKLYGNMTVKATFEDAAEKLKWTLEDSASS